jgi:hypothetical protein
MKKKYSHIRIEYRRAAVAALERKPPEAVQRFTEPHKHWPK